MIEAKKATVIKVLTVGEGGVGKTTLLHRYKKNEFLADTRMTLGVGFFMKRLNVDGRIIHMQLWDFGGQEQFRFMLKRYALGARGAILGYDLTRLGTLEKVEDWIKICRKDNSELPIILVGTKTDLQQNHEQSDGFAEEIMNTFNLFDHIKVSSKTGENVPSVFDILSKKILELDGT